MTWVIERLYRTKRNVALGTLALRGQRVLDSPRDRSRIVRAPHPLAVYAETHRAEDIVDKRIATATVCAEVRAIVELDCEDRAKRRGITEDEVDVLGRQLIECVGIGPTVQVLTKVRESDLGEHDVPPAC